MNTAMAYERAIIIPCSRYKYGKRTRREFSERFYFYFSLVDILGAFLTVKQLFHSRLLDMR